MGERRRDEFLVHRLELPPSTVARRPTSTLDLEPVRRRAAANGEIHPIADLERQTREVGLVSAPQAQAIIKKYALRFGPLPPPIRIKPRVKPMVDMESVKIRLGM